jgi:hypothetical protein
VKNKIKSRYDGVCNLVAVDWPTLSLRPLQYLTLSDGKLWTRSDTPNTTLRARMRVRIGEGLA